MPLTTAIADAGTHLAQYVSAGSVGSVPPPGTLATQEIADLAEALVGLIGSVFSCRVGGAGPAWPGQSEQAAMPGLAGAIPVLTAAAGSLIDTDLDRESARLLALSARQCAVSPASGLSGHSPRTVLSLFK